MSIDIILALLHNQSKILSAHPGRSRSQFHYWLFGHYHDNQIIDEKYVLLYEQMVRIL